MRRRAALVLALGLAACARARPIPLAKVNVSRMAGDWYILATIPNFFERGMVAPHDIYSPRPAGDIRDVAPPKLARPRIDC